MPSFQSCAVEILLAPALFVVAGKQVAVTLVDVVRGKGYCPLCLEELVPSADGQGQACLVGHYQGGIVPERGGSPVISPAQAPARFILHLESLRLALSSWQESQALSFPTVVFAEYHEVRAALRAAISAAEQQGRSVGQELR